MKKQGFTLAEVLITLTIIGVVAVLTLPALMTNTNEQQAKTALAKMTNTFTNAAHLAQANLGFDFASVDQATDPGAGAVANEQTRSIYNILVNTASINQSVADIEDFMGLNRRIDFNDGTSLFFDGTASVAGDGARDANGVAEVMADGSIRGFQVIFDTNGTKGPNIISNCQGQAAGVDAWDGDNASAGTNNGATGCENRNNRVIRDRFMMRLRGSFVTPVGAASMWALTNSSAPEEGGDRVPTLNQGV